MISYLANFYKSKNKETVEKNHDAYSKWNLVW
jgi:hypothetical protein